MSPAAKSGNTPEVELFGSTFDISPVGRCGMPWVKPARRHGPGQSLLTTRAFVSKVWPSQCLNRRQNQVGIDLAAGDTDVGSRPLGVREALGVDIVRVTPLGHASRRQARRGPPGGPQVAAPWRWDGEWLQRHLRTWIASWRWLFAGVGTIGTGVKSTARPAPVCLPEAERAERHRESCFLKPKAKPVNQLAIVAPAISGAVSLADTAGDDDLRDFVLAEKAESSRRSYATDFRQFPGSWCLSMGSDPLPARHRRRCWRCTRPARPGIAA